MMKNVKPYQPPKIVPIDNKWTVPPGWQAKITIVNPDPCEEDQLVELEEGETFVFDMLDQNYRLFVRLPNGIEATYNLIAGEFFLATQLFDYLVTQDNKLIKVNI
jgi:hypothetical protein